MPRRLTSIEFACEPSLSCSFSLHNLGALRMNVGTGKEVASQLPFLRHEGDYPCPADRILSNPVQNRWSRASRNRAKFANVMAGKGWNTHNPDLDCLPR
jgi:hypothetical protein